MACPISAEIEGKGVGAVRHCIFTTGAFVEPITVWDEPNTLAFDVTEQPPPMKELSPYDIRPPSRRASAERPRRVSPHSATRWPKPTRRNDLVSPQHVAGKLLAIVVGFSHPPYPRASTPPCEKTSRNGEVAVKVWVTSKLPSSSQDVGKSGT